MFNKNDSEELNIYFNDIKKYPTLTKEKEIELGYKIKKGDKSAYNELVNANLKYVVMIAKQYSHYDISLFDLISEGNLGLIKAIEKYDYTKGFKLITFASWWIKNYIQMFIKEHYKPNDVNIDFSNLGENTPLIYKNQSENINEEFTEEINNAINSDNKIENLMSALQKREYKIVELYYGLFGNKEHTLAEISNELNISMERVRQIKDKAILKLRSKALITKCQF